MHALPARLDVIRSKIRVPKTVQGFYRERYKGNAENDEKGFYRKRYNGHAARRDRCDEAIRKSSTVYNSRTVFNTRIWIFGPTMLLDGRFLGWSFLSVWSMCVGVSWI